MTTNKKYKILRCIDQAFWCYSFISQEHEKYTYHDMNHAIHNEVHYNADLLYIHSSDITPAHAESIPLMAKQKNVKVVGAYAGNPLYWSDSCKRVYSHSDLIVTISPQTYEFAKQNYPANHPIVFLPESVDNKYFSCTRKKYNEVPVIGWAGGAHKKIKRTHLLDKLILPVKIKSDWKLQRESGVTIPVTMPEFYNSIDILVITSESECMPRVALEAMACGCVVISTDVGGMRMLIDPDMIVPTFPEELSVKSINEKLKLLLYYPELIPAIGQRNKDFIDNYWSWEKNSKLWDDVFTNVIENKLDKAIELADSYVKIYDYCWEELRTQFKNEQKQKASLKLAELPKKRITTGTLIHPEISQIENKKASDKKIEPIAQIIEDLNSTDIPYWFLQKACLDCINYEGEQINSNIISIGVENIVDAMDLYADLREMQYTCKNSYCLIQLNTNIEIEIIIDKNRMTKPMVCYNKPVRVPYPVIPYLRNIYGQNYNTLK